MIRRVAVLGLFVALVALAGCSTILGPGEPDPEQLAMNASYDWDANATAHVEVERSSFSAVYDVSNRSRLVANSSALEVYVRDDLGRERHLSISALRYRYANGTTVAANQSSALSVEQTRQRTIISLPNESGGQVAFTAPRHGKHFTIPVYVEGSHAVRMPADARVGIPFLSQVRPGEYRTSTNGEFMTVRWDSVTAQQISVRWYLQRDLVLFGVLTAAAITIGSGGAVYYYRQIQRLKRRREESAIDVDVDDDPRDRGPPPGMR